MIEFEVENTLYELTSVFERCSGVQVQVHVHVHRRLIHREFRIARTCYCMYVVICMKFSVCIDMMSHRDYVVRAI